MNGNFFAELKRRNVYKVAVAYAVVAWVLVQAASIVFPTYEAPPWVMKVFVALVALGFPIALIIAWAFELTSEGLKRTEEADPAQARPKSHAWIYIVVIAAALSVGLFFIGRYGARNITGAAEQTELPAKSIAVLPLVNASGDPDNEYFSDGLSEELIGVLAKLPALKVIGRSSSFTFKGTSEDSRTIGKKLGVANLLEGTVRKEGERVRIMAELISTADGRELWTETYERELKDIFAVQSEIAKAVTTQLKIKLLSLPPESDAAPFTENVVAYTAFQQGEFYASREGDNEKNLRKAMEFYNEAIRLDPFYALAYASLSDAWVRVGEFYANINDIAPAYAKARSSAQTALSLQPNIPEAHGAMGGVLLFADHNFDEAAAQFRRAEALAPSDIGPKFRLSYLFLTEGRLEEAEDMCRKYLALEPLVTGASLSLGRVLIARGRYDEAESWLRKGVELFPNTIRWHTWITNIYLLKGDTAAALKEAQLEPPGFWQDYAVALAQQAQGNVAAADAALQEFIEKHGTQGPFQIACIYALRKQPDEMFTWLERAYAANDAGLTQLLTIPFIHDYRGDPRFVALAQKLKLPLPPAAGGKS